MEKKHETQHKCPLGKECFSRKKIFAVTFLHRDFITRRVFGPKERIYKLKKNCEENRTFLKINFFKTDHLVVFILPRWVGST